MENLGGGDVERKINPAEYAREVGYRVLENGGTASEAAKAAAKACKEVRFYMLAENCAC